MGSCDVEPERSFIKVGEHVLSIETVENYDSEESCIYISELSKDDIKAFEEDREEDGGLDQTEIKTLGMWGYDALCFKPTVFLENYLDNCEYVLEDRLSKKDTKEISKEFRERILDE